MNHHDIIYIKLSTPSFLRRTIQYYLHIINTIKSTFIGCATRSNETITLSEISLSNCWESRYISHAKKPQAQNDQNMPTDWFLTLLQHLCAARTWFTSNFMYFSRRKHVFFAYILWIRGTNNSYFKCINPFLYAKISRLKPSSHSLWNKEDLNSRLMNK